MLNFKNEIAKIISNITNINVNELEGYIEIPPDENMGDYAFPSFKLAKELRKAPPVIANELKEKIEVENEILDKVEVVGGYLNFYINKSTLIKNTLVDAERIKLMIINNYVKYLGNTYASLTLKKIELIINELRISLYRKKQDKIIDYYVNSYEEEMDSKRGRGR